MSNTGASATIRRVVTRTSSARSSGPVSDGGRSNSVNEWLPIIAGIRPAVVGHERGPAGPCRILIVRVVAQFAIEVGVFRQLLAVEPDAEARPVRDLDCSRFVRQLPSLDDVVHQ